MPEEKSLKEENPKEHPDYPAWEEFQAYIKAHHCNDYATVDWITFLAGYNAGHNAGYHQCIHVERWKAIEARINKPNEEESDNA